MRLDDWLAAAADRRETAGLTRTLRPRAATETTIDLAGNDYLGLSRDPRVTAAAAKAAETWGAGAGASRLVTGTTDLHTELESELASGLGPGQASGLGAPAALVFSTGYHANLAVLTALADDDTLIVSDAHVHASLVDACRLSRGRVAVVPHGDLVAVEAALAGRTQHRAIVVVESIYSVLGDAAPLVDLVALCERYDATLVVDEAHGIGVAGDGRGLVQALGLAGHPAVVLTLTLSKSLGSQGGAVLASPAVVAHLVNTARPFIFDTGLAPAATAAALEAWRIVRAEPGLVRRLDDAVTALADAAGSDRPAGAVLSVPMASPQVAVAAQAACAERGVRVGCFRPPSVPDGISRLRLTASAGLTDEDLDAACGVVRDVVTAVSR